MKQQFSILIMAFFGFLLLPSLSYACNQTADQAAHSCRANENSHSADDSCCVSQQSQRHHDDGCGSDCSHSACHCVSCSVVVPALSADSNLFPVAEKQLSFRNELFLSSEFLSIWVPPKIG